MERSSYEMLLAVAQIGPRRASRLIDGLGDEWASLVDADPERAFFTLRGMGARRAALAGRSWRALRGGGAASRRGWSVHP